MTSINNAECLSLCQRDFTKLESSQLNIMHQKIMIKHGI